MKLAIDYGITNPVVTKEGMVTCKITEAFHDSGMTFIKNASGIPDNVWEQNRVTILPVYHY